MKPSDLARRRILTGLPAAPLALSAAPAPARWNLVIGCDHAGFPLKANVIKTLQSWGHTVKDVGTYSAEPVDFPDVAQKVAAEILEGRSQRGIMVCGTGVGACIAANKIRGIRAALCQDSYCGRQCVEHDDVNVLCLGGWIIGPLIADEIMRAFLDAKFLSSNPDFARRVRKLNEMDKR